jgi:hypothetical protein
MSRTSGSAWFHTLNHAQIAVVIISVITVVLWCCSTAWADVIGNQGIVAMLPLIAFFGSGILDKDDFNSFLWHVVMLAQARDPRAAVFCHGDTGLQWTGCCKRVGRLRVAHLSACTKQVLYSAHGGPLICCNTS